MTLVELLRVIIFVYAVAGALLFSVLAVRFRLRLAQLTVESARLFLLAVIYGLWVAAAENFMWLIWIGRVYADRLQGRPSSSPEGVLFTMIVFIVVRVVQLLLVGRATVFYRTSQRLRIVENHLHSDQEDQHGPVPADD